MYRNLLNLSGYVRRVGNLFDVLKDLRSKKVESNGKMENLDHIKFENATIRTPGEDGVILAKGLNFEVIEGKNTIITGPNGSGKSSLYVNSSKFFFFNFISSIGSEF